MDSRDVPPTTKPYGSPGRKTSGTFVTTCISVLTVVVVITFGVVLVAKQQAKAKATREAQSEQTVNQMTQVATESIQEVSEPQPEAEPEPEPEPEKMTLTAVTPNCKVYSFWQNDQYVYVVEGKDCRISN